MINIIEFDDGQPAYEYFLQNNKKKVPESL